MFVVFVVGESASMLVEEERKDRIEERKENVEEEKSKKEGEALNPVSEPINNQEFYSQVMVGS